MTSFLFLVAGGIIGVVLMCIIIVGKTSDECEHNNNLVPFGKDKVYCPSCDRVWNVEYHHDQ